MSVPGGVLSLNNDKNRNHSTSVEDTGYAVLNTRSNLGTVMHFLSSSITGLCLGGVLQPKGSTKLQIVTKVLQVLTEDPSMLRQIVACLCVDRSYGVREVVSWVVEYCVKFLRTVPPNRNISH